MRVATAYRTISGDALLMLAGTPPINLLVKELAEIHEAQRRGENVAEARRVARANRSNTWQERWRTIQKDTWTRRLIPDVPPLLDRRHGYTTYHITQALSGHGCFAAYLHRFGLLESARCWFYGRASDDALHTFFECPAWEVQRAELVQKIGAFTPKDLAGKMTGEKRSWDAAAGFVAGVLKTKEEEERRRQAIRS